MIGLIENSSILCFQDLLTSLYGNKSVMYQYIKLLGVLKTRITLKSVMVDKHINNNTGCLNALHNCRMCRERVPT